MSIDARFVVILKVRTVLIREVSSEEIVRERGSWETVKITFAKDFDISCISIEVISHYVLISGNWNMLSPDPIS